MIMEDMILYDGLDGALVGFTERNGKYIAIYNFDYIITILTEVHGMTFEEAVEYFEFNIAGGWLGENTPIIQYEIPF